MLAGLAAGAGCDAIVQAPGVLRSVPLEETFIAGDSVEAVPLAAWTLTGDGGTQVSTATGKRDVDAAPADASRYTQKSYVFPTGTIRVLTFSDQDGGMLHPLTVENALYMLDGAGTVEVVDETVDIGQGDFVSYPSGTLRGEGSATVILWTVTGLTENPMPMVVRGAEAPVTRLGYWNGPDGNRVLATTPEDIANAPDHAIRLDMTLYEFDGNSAAVTKNYKGGPTNKTRGDRDGLLYITSGKMRYFQDDIDVIAVPGDAIRESGGHYHHWIRLEDSSFVAIGTGPVITFDEDASSDY